jgi:hypothetical protein
VTFNIKLTVGIIFTSYRATMKVAYMLCRTACTRSYVYEQKSKQDNFLYYGQQRMYERFYRCDTLELNFFLSIPQNMIDKYFLNSVPFGSFKCSSYKKAILMPTSYCRMSCEATGQQVTSVVRNKMPLYTRNLRFIDEARMCRTCHYCVDMGKWVRIQTSASIYEFPFPEAQFPSNQNI